MTTRPNLQTGHAHRLLNIAEFGLRDPSQEREVIAMAEHMDQLQLRVNAERTLASRLNGVISNLIDQGNIKVNDLDDLEWIVAELKKGM